MKKFYTAKYDRVFKAIFCKEENKELMREFLSRVLNKRIENVTFLRPEIEINHSYEKVKTVDVFALVDGEYTHIELNTNSEKFLHVRNFIYFTSLYNKKIRRGEKYDLVSKFLHLDFTYGMGCKKEVKQEYFVQSMDGELYIDNFEIIEYNLDKIMSFWYSKDEENIQKYKHFIMLDLEKEELRELTKGEKGFMENYEKSLNELNDDEYFQTDITREEDMIMCFNTEKELAYQKGVEEGKKDLEERNQEIVSNMLKENMNLELIHNITKLSIDEITKIQANLN